MVHPKNQTAKALIKKNLSLIQQWREAGYSLPSIHEALKAQSTLSCSFDHFRKCYYELRRAPVSTKQPNDWPIQKTAHEGALPDEISTPSQSSNSLNEKVEPMSIEEKMERAQRLAAAVFQRRREGKLP